MVDIREETGWNQMRYDIRTYTIQNERNRVSGNPGEIPEDYMYVGDKCFLNNGKVHGVTLPPGCKVIGKHAFEGCQFQKTVSFPPSLTEIKKRAFAGNRRLRKTFFPYTVEKVGTECYRECSSLKIVEFEKNSRCKTISEGTFDSCTRLEKVCLPDTLKVIKKRAFYRCKELKKIAIPNSVTNIGKEAFYFCGLEELQLPVSLKIIDDSAFFRCKNLKTVFIPPNVRVIGRWAFHGCSRLEKLEIFHDPDEIGPWIINKSCTIVCQKGSKIDAYGEEYGFRREYVDIPEELNG